MSDNLTLADVFAPTLVGASKVRGFEVQVFGYALDSQGQYIALAIAESKTRCQAVWAAFLKGDLIEIQAKGKRRPVSGRREKGKDLYETLLGDLPGSGGHITPYSCTAPRSPPSSPSRVNECYRPTPKPGGSIR